MPLTNRVKSAVNTAIQQINTPTLHQQATMTARGQLENTMPHADRPGSKEGLGVLGSIVKTASSIERSANQIGQLTNTFNKSSGLGKVVAGANLVSGAISAVSNVTSDISNFFSGAPIEKQTPVTMVQQVSANIPGISKFVNPSSIFGGSASNSLTLGGIGTNLGNPLTAIELGGSQQLMDILLTHGKKTENAENKYRIIFQFKGNDKTPYDDVLLFAVHRFGFTKSCPLSVAQINLPPVLVAQLKQEQDKNFAFEVNIKIYQVDTENRNKLKNLILDRNFVGRAIKEETDPSIEKGNSVKCSLSIYNPTLFQMDVMYTYNKIHNNKTPYEILQDFESFITANYGDNFVSKHILGKKNEYKYEQILTQPTDQDIKLPNRKDFKFMCKHDSDIPLFLNYKYKIDNTLSFYFFDDFDLKSEKEITRFFIALYDKNKFEKFKVGNQQDIIKQTQLMNSYPFNDPDGLLTPGDTAGASKLINGEFSPKKDQSSSSIQGNTQIKGRGSTSGGDPSREFNAQKTTETQHQIPTKKKQSNNQIPDSVDGNDVRNESAHKLFSERISQLDRFVTKNCGFDFPRFGVIYPMNEKKPNEYLHTPIAISNVFKRENSKESVLSHSVKFLAVKFSPQAESEPTSQSNSSNTGENKQRDATNKAKEADPKKTSKTAEQNTKKKTERPAKTESASGEKKVTPQKGSSGNATPPQQSTTPPPPETPKGPATNKPSETKQTRSFDRAYFRDDGGGD